jgi:hypothetical protein
MYVSTLSVKVEKSGRKWGGPRARMWGVYEGGANKGL